MSGFVKRTQQRNVNPAGGINPAVQPNVGQYGWTSFDAANVNQLIDYVKAAREAAESAQNDAVYIKLQLANIDNTVLYFERLYNEIKPIAVNIEAIYLEVVKLRDQVAIEYADIQKMHEAILVMFAEVQTILNEMRSLRDETKVYKDSAKASETASVEAMQKSIEIYEELKKGQVYRGTWNPNTAKYPDNGNTNSVWDVILNTGQDQVAFDGKNWFFGDRLIYVKDTNKYEQLEAGTNVKSVNGKTGSVVLEALDVKAVPLAGGTMTGQLNVNAPIQVNKGHAIRAIDDSSVNTRMVPSNGYGYFQAGHTTDLDNQKMLLTGMSGRGLTEFQIRMIDGSQPQIRIGSNNYNIYHSGNKPTASDVGAVARGGDTMSGPLTVPASKGIRTSTQSDGTYTSISSESGYSLLWKQNQSSTISDEFIGIKSSTLLFRQDLKAGDKTYRDNHVYHTGFKPTAAEIGAMGSAGGTITGDMILNEKLTVKKDMIVDMGRGLRKVTKELGLIDNNKSALVMLCPNSTASGRNAQGFEGRISIFRGASDQYNLVSWVDLTARVAYTELAATIHDQYNSRQTANSLKLVIVTYKSEQWIALSIPSTASRIVTMEGIVTNVEPEFIKDATGYTTVDFITDNEVVRSTRQTKTLDVTDTSSSGGYRFNTKVAIGGVNDTWLRLNPNNHFSAGIYIPSGIIRHDGGDIQLKNWGTGSAKPVRFAIPASDQYVTSNPGQAVVNVKTPASNNATRLLNVYDDAGKLKTSIVARDDTAGSLSFITDGGTDAKNRVAIYGGQVYAMGTQVANENALTKVSYTEGRYVKKTGDTITGKLVATDVEARLTHSLGYLSIKPYGSTYDDGTFIRGYYRAHDNGKPGEGWAGIKWDKFTPAAGSTPSISESFDMQLGNNFVYHTGRKPTADELKVMSTESTQVNTAVDLNNYVINGNYNIYAVSASNLTNAPEGFQYGTLQVIGRGSVTHSFVTQTLTNKNNNHQWVRTRTDGAFAWSKWDKIFSEANPPTVDQLDAVKRTGDTMTGHLYMDNNADLYLVGQESNNPIVWFQDKATVKNKVAIFHDRAGDRFAINHYDTATSGYAAFRLKFGEKAPVYSPGSGGNFFMYHEGFKPNANDVGSPVLNSSTKAIELQSTVSSVKPGAIRTEQDGNQQVSWMTDKSLTENYKAIGVHSLRGPVYNDGTIREIYHTGRKPTAADIDGVLTRGAWGLGDSQTFADSAMAENYTEDKSRDLNKLITSGTYTVNGSWINVYDNKGTARTMYAAIQVIARKATTGMTVYQKLILDKTGDGSRTLERQGNGEYPNMTWSLWKETGTYENNLEYRLTVERPGATTYPYVTMHKRDDRTDLTSGYYTTGALQFKHGEKTDDNNPDSGKLISVLRADTSWDRKENRTAWQIRRASDNGVGSEVVLYEAKMLLSSPSIEGYEYKSLASNSYRMADGQIGTFWRKDSDNLYLMRTEAGQARDGTWTSHRPFSMKLSDGSVTIGNTLTVKGGLTVADGILRTNTVHIRGYGDTTMLRDHGNGNVTLSASTSTTGVPGTLYLGYNAGETYKTNNIRIDAPVINKTGLSLINGDGLLNGDALSFGSFQVLKDGNNVYHTIVGGNDTVNRGRTIIAGGEAGKVIHENTSTGAETIHIGADGSDGLYVHTGLQNGWNSNTHRQVKFLNGEMYAVDGTNRVYHQGYKPTAADINAAPGGFGLGGNGGRCPGEDCNQAVASGFYGIYGSTVNTPEGTGPSGSKMLVTAWSNQHVSQTFYRVTSNRTWTRSSRLNGSVVEWTAWAEIFSEGHLPTADEVGAVGLTGNQTMTGRLTGSGFTSTTAGNAFQTAATTDGAYTTLSAEGGHTMFWRRNASTTKSDEFVSINNNSALLFRQDAGSGDKKYRDYQVYHQGYKPTAADVGAFPVTGGNIAGGVNIVDDAGLVVRNTAGTYGFRQIVSAGNVYLQAGKIDKDVNDQKMILGGYTGVPLSFLRMQMKDQAHVYVQWGSADHRVYHQGYKPQPSELGVYSKAEADAATTSVMLGKSIGTGLKLGGSVDLNTMTTPGVYFQDSNSNATSGANYPVPLAGSLVVYQGAGWHQEYRVYNSAHVYIRAKYSTGDWTPWHRQYNTQAKPTAADVGALPLAGGTLTGDVTTTQKVNFVGGHAKFYEGSGTHHNILAKGNTLEFATGGNAETQRMVLAADGVLGLNNSLIVNDGIIRNNRSQNPMMELHLVGQHAYITYVDGEGNYRIGTSNGAGTLSSNALYVNPSQAVANGQYKSLGHTSRAWTSIGKAGLFIDNGAATFSSGSLAGTTSNFMKLTSNGNQVEQIVGYLHQATHGTSSHTFSTMDHTVGERKSWFFDNEGKMTNPLGSYFDITANINGRTFDGFITQWCVARFAPLSDGRLKTVLRDSKGSALDVVDKFKFSTYVWNADAGKINTTRAKKTVDFGLIAQEVEEIDPTFVKTINTMGETGTQETEVKTLDTANLLALALKSIQELRSEVDELKRQLATK